VQEAEEDEQPVRGTKKDELMKGGKSKVMVSSQKGRKRRSKSVHSPPVPNKRDVSKQKRWGERGRELP
jgi:hypothetical protein